MIHVINIALCDDDTIFLDSLSKYLENADRQGYEFNINKFSSGDSLIASLENGEYYDIYFLDIEMPGSTGIQLGNIIRREYGHETSIFIFISNYTSYFGELFELHTYDFIKKPLKEDEVNKKLSGILHYLRMITERNMIFDKKIFAFHDTKSSLLLSLREIYYLESKGHYINLAYIADQGLKYLKYKAVSKVEFERFPDEYFVHPHASFLVNMNHIRRYSKKFITMERGNEIPISFSEREKAMEKMGLFFLKRDAEWNRRENK